MSDIGSWQHQHSREDSEGNPAQTRPELRGLGCTGLDTLFGLEPYPWGSCIVATLACAHLHNAAQLVLAQYPQLFGSWHLSGFYAYNLGTLCKEVS